MVGKEFRNLEGSFLILAEEYRPETEHIMGGGGTLNVNCPVLVWVLCAVCLEDEVEPGRGAAAVCGGGWEGIRI